ncbi:MAG: bifunctional adenosylcobinamide kinase/adenosylcobinamide-phosphate guanylyltransferase [Burkholderiaceae bacterium]|nr:bifunctional adenosylcobinamide kinase/adenosylcobinamide-phosphate guanylyltransferase [Burkholderiaceae bacterium]
MHELILGGQRSGKSRCAEQRAAVWLATPSRSAVLLATARAGDEEMRRRIAHHRLQRAECLPALQCEEVPIELAQAIFRHSAPDRLVVIDCLTLWLTSLLMPIDAAPLDDIEWDRTREALCDAVSEASGPVLLVSNEIGLGVAPMSREARRFVDELGRLHQAMAARCDDVTLMVAGIEVPVKRGRR